LENILQELKKLNIKNSVMGKNGDYYLAKGKFYFCKETSSCKTNAVFADIYTILKLKETTLKDL
jgi:hypothetical protein